MKHKWVNRLAWCGVGVLTLLTLAPTEGLASATEIVSDLKDKSDGGVAAIKVLFAIGAPLWMAYYILRGVFGNEHKKKEMFIAAGWVAFGATLLLSMAKIITFFDLTSLG